MIKFNARLSIPASIMTMKCRKPFLNAGSGSHAVQTARIMAPLEKLCQEEKADLVIVVGDVNSTLGPVE